jgi:hypothetical protein
MINNIAQILIKSVIVSLVIMIMMLVVFIAGPSIEGHLSPVVSDMRFVKTGIDTYQVSGIKVRNCKFIGLSGLVNTGTKIEKVDFKFTEDNGAERPVGLQSFGSWIIHPPGTLLVVYSMHQCHNLWQTQTKNY